LRNGWLPPDVWSHPDIDGVRERLQGSMVGSLAMRDIEAVVSDLEWRRIRRRVAMHPVFAMVANVGTAVLLIALKLIR
jgi:hypothetical protein